MTSAEIKIYQLSSRNWLGRCIFSLSNFQIPKSCIVIQQIIALRTLLKVMANYYRELKPALNKLSELNIWDSLLVIRQYFMSTIYNYNIARTHFEDIESPRDFPIPPYLVDFMISATLRYSTTLTSKKSLKQAKQRKAIIRLFLDAFDNANREHDDDILIWLKTYIMNQQKMQHQEFFGDRVYKYLYLYSAPDLSEHLSNRLGMDIKKYFRLVMVLYFAFSRLFYYTYENLRDSVVGNGTRFNEKDLRLILNVLSDTLTHIKETITVDFSNKLFVCYNDAIHVSKPVIWDENTLYCTVPTYILNAGIEGLQYRLDIKSKENTCLNSIFATRFEDYVGLQLEYYSKGGKFKFIKELTYLKGQNKTSDWIIYDDQSIVFLDCKLKKLTIRSIMETSLDREQLNQILKSGKLNTKKNIEDLQKEQQSPLIKDLIGIGVDLGKILCCYCDWRDGKIKELPAFSDRIHITASVLTLEETLCNEVEIKNCIDRIANQYVLEKKGIALERIDTRVISSIDFDGNIPYIGENGLTRYVDNKYQVPDNSYLENRFLKEHFEAFLYYKSQYEE